MSKLKIEHKEERSRIRKRNKAVIIVVVLLLSPFLIGGAWLWFQVNAFGSAGEGVKIEISSGTGTSEIGEILQENNIVRSGSAFAIYSRLKGNIYQAGLYEMPKNISAGKAASILQEGPQINYEKFTILPGQRLTDVRNNVDELPEMSGTVFDELIASEQYRSRFLPEGSNNLEGLLLPETYSISATESEANIIQRSLQEFDARAQTNGLSGDFNGLSAYEIIIVASLIEKEARFSDDRPLIASVIYNRLAIGMRLQIDATTIYGQGRSGGGPSPAENQIDGPFNTYTRNGLPPTPISMISMDSLRAALNPADSDFLFYVLKDRDTGEHAFGKTFEEHRANIERAKATGDL